jgi:exocyst complex component 3
MTAQGNATVIKIKATEKGKGNESSLKSESTKRETEIAVLESQLTASIRLQIENIRAGISQMDQMASETLPRALPSKLSSIVSLCDETDAMISNFNFIKLVSRTHANFQDTRAIYDQFKVLDEQIDRISQLLQMDMNNGTIDNLLLIYCRLAQLISFRDQTLEMVKNSSSSLLYQLKRYFKKLDDLSESFDSFYWNLPGKLELLPAGDIVKIALVLSKMADSNRSRFFEIIDNSVSQKFTNTSKIVKQTVDFDQILDEISFYSQDLELIRDKLSPRFPPSLGLLDFHLLAYHRNIHRIISQLISAVKPKEANGTLGLTAGQILSLLGWVRKYHETLENQFGIASDELEPHLLDEKEPKLISDYVRLSRKKITEWINNLLQSESKYFIERKALPDADGEDRYFTPATVDLFQIVKQHIDMAASVSSGRLLSEIVNECVNNISNFQKGLVKLLEQESIKYFDKPEGAIPYFEDYLIMMGNSSLRWIENMQNLNGLMDDLLKPEFLGPAQKQLKSASDGFLNIAKAATKVLVDLICFAIKICTGQLFSLEWYNDNSVIETVVATFEDFFTDYQRHAEEFLMVKLIADVLERTVIIYIEGMRGRNSKLRMQQGSAADLFAHDIETLQKFFSRFRESKKVEKALDPLVKLRTLLMASEKMIFLEFFALIKTYPDVPLALIEELLGKRDDMDKQTLKELVDSIRSKLKEEKHIENTNPSIFSKLKKILPKTTK